MYNNKYYFIQYIKILKIKFNISTVKTWMDHISLSVNTLVTVVFMYVFCIYIASLIRHFSNFT